MQEQVTLVKNREQVAILVGERIDRLERRIAQGLEARHVSHAHQHSQIQRCRQRVDILGLEIELAFERGPQVRRRHLFDLEAHDIASAAPLDFPFDDLELRMSALVVQLQLGVTAEANARGLPDRLTRKELRQVDPDDFLEQHERDRIGLRDADKTRQSGWHLNDGKPRLGAVSNGPEQQRQVQTEWSE